MTKPKVFSLKVLTDYKITTEKKTGFMKVGFSIHKVA